MLRFALLLLGFYTIGLIAQPKDALIERRAFPFFQVQFSSGKGIQDLSGSRYKLVNNIGPGFGYKFKNNISIAFETNFTFGNMERNQDLLTFSTTDSFLITREGNLDDPFPFQRGADFKINAILPLFSSPNAPNSSFAIQPSIGWGYSYVYYRVEDPQNIPLLNQQYRKGIDKLRSGFQYQIMALYDWHSNNNLRNFRLGIYYQYRNARNRRTYSFDGLETKEVYQDSHIGLRVDWNLPFVSSKVTSQGIVY